MKGKEDKHEVSVKRKNSPEPRNGQKERNPLKGKGGTRLG